MTVARTVLLIIKCVHSCRHFNKFFSKYLIFGNYVRPIFFAIEFHSIDLMYSIQTKMMSSTESTLQIWMDCSWSRIPDILCCDICGKGIRTFTHHFFYWLEKREWACQCVNVCEPLHNTLYRFCHIHFYDFGFNKNYYAYDTHSMYI